MTNRINDGSFKRKATDPCLGEQPCDYRLKILRTSLGGKSNGQTPQIFLGEDVSFSVGSISLRNRKSRGKHLWQRFLALIHNLLRKGQLIVCLQLIEAYSVRARERTCKRVYVFKSSRASFPAVRGTFLHQFLHFNSGPRAPMSMTKNIYTVNRFFKD